MRVSLQHLSCLALLFGVRAHAFASDGYEAAFAQADEAERAGDLGGAARALENVLSAYPRDYALALRLGWIHFRLKHYIEAERWYRLAIAVSDGSAEASIGLAWSLVYQERCSEAEPVLHGVLEATPLDTRAQQALATCAARFRPHASLWLSFDGALYHDNPWKARSGDVAGGGVVTPYPWLQLGAAYRFLALASNDSRVAGYAQHEAHLEAGYTSERVDVLAHGALISSAGDVLSASRHVGLSGRLRYFGELLLELSGSFYQDLWVARLAPAWQLTWGVFSVTPGFALQRFARETLGSASLGAAFTWARWMLWINAKYGDEYRAAYLTQFAVVNSEDRTTWGVSAGLRVRFGERFALFGSYGFNRLKSPDGLRSDLHLLSVGTALTL
jgi:Tetratricopeptide repeat